MYKDYYEACGVTQHAEFESYLKEIIFNKEKREEFYKKLLDINCDVSIDSFKPYFELYSAERKSHQQDYTPDSVAKILAILTRSDGASSNKYAGADITAGTGSLLIQKWNDDRMQESIFSYAPHRYLYYAEELADNAIPYLLHNLALRGMNCIVIHGDALERKAKQVYFVQNSKDDFMGFSDINVMPHSEAVAQEFNILEWMQDAIEHIESDVVIANYALPAQKKKEKIKQNFFKQDIDLKEKPKGYQLTLGDIANVERAVKKKIYPMGTIVIQLSATSGQIGLLKSSGEVENKYACINLKDIPLTVELKYIDYLNKTNYLFYKLQTNDIKNYLNRIKQGLNIVISDLEKIILFSLIN